MIVDFSILPILCFLYNRNFYQMQLTIKSGILGCFLILSSALLGQNQPLGRCGTMPTTLSEERLDRNIAFLAANPDILQERAVQYVPIRFTIVRGASGTGGVAIKSIFRLLCRLNLDYADQNIQFYMKDDFKYLNNDLANTDPQGSGGGNILKNQKDNKAINMFFVSDIKSDSPGTILGFFNPQHDFVVIKNSEVNYSAQTTSHELGHFFSLEHTFNGWECGQWTEEEYGMTVTATKVICSNANIELVNKSNCATSGDKVCDTPPDYNFGFGWPNDCRPFNLDVRDRNDELIRPSQNNFMSYFFGCTGWHFSQGQKDLVRADLSSAQRAYLTSTYIPPVTSLLETIEYQSPVDSAQALRSEAITLNWAAVPGATFYILEYSKNKSFGSAVTTVELVSTNQFVIPAGTFNNATEYGFWRVTAMNPYATCNSVLDYESFKLVNVLGTKGIEDLNDWSVQPNVITANEQVNLSINAKESFEAKINITASNGQKVLNNFSKKLIAGENNFGISEVQLQPGIYIITLTNKGGVSSKKLIVQ